MLKKLKIKSRLLLCFLTVDLLVLMMTMAGLTGLKYALKNLNNLTQAIVPANTMILSCRVSSNTAAAKLGEMILARDYSAYQEDAAVVRELIDSLNESLEFLDSIYIAGTQRENLEEYVQLMDEWEESAQSILERLAQADYQGAQSLLTESVSLRLELVETAQRMTENIEVVRDETVESSRSQAVQFSYLLLILLLLATAISVILTFRLTYGIASPLREIRDAADEMANGNLKIHIDYKGTDELGGLADSMRTMSDRVSFYMSQITSDMEQLASGNLAVRKHEPFLGDFLPAQTAIVTMMESLNQTVTQIDQAAEQVANGSDQVSASSLALSQGAAEQVSSVEQLAATMEEISYKVKLNAQKAQETQETVATVNGRLTVSNRQMTEMTKAMDEIAGSSKEIEKIIKTIEDIAFQTNILALNAAVEAARAGAAGKGFAVVANEVRNLASKSSEASKSTSALIERSLQSVRNGSLIATETASSLSAVVDGTKEIVSQVTHIAETSEMQAEAAQQIAAGIEQISSVIQTNSATAEESAAASEELSSLSQVLKGLVDQFQLA